MAKPIPAGHWPIRPYDPDCSETIEWRSDADATRISKLMIEKSDSWDPNEPNFSQVWALILRRGTEPNQRTVTLPLIYQLLKERLSAPDARLHTTETTIQTVRAPRRAFNGDAVAKALNHAAIELDDAARLATTLFPICDDDRRFGVHIDRGSPVPPQSHEWVRCVTDPMYAALNCLTEAFNELGAHSEFGERNRPNFYADWARWERVIIRTLPKQRAQALVTMGRRLYQLYPPEQYHEGEHRHSLPVALPTQLESIAGVLRHEAGRLPESGKQLSPQEDERPGAAQARGAAGGETDWRDLQRRLLEWCERGDAYTSIGDLAKRLRCAKATIHKAIKDSSKLKGWQARHTKGSPRAGSLTEIVTDNTEQTRETDPAHATDADDVDIVFARLIQEAEPGERAKLNKLTTEQRQQMIALLENDPDIYDRVMGRKP